MERRPGLSRTEEGRGGKGSCTPESTTAGTPREAATARWEETRGDERTGEEHGVWGEVAAADRRRRWKKEEMKPRVNDGKKTRVGSRETRQWGHASSQTKCVGTQHWRQSDGRDKKREIE